MASSVDTCCCGSKFARAPHLARAPGSSARSRRWRGGSMNTWAASPLCLGLKIRRARRIVSVSAGDQQETRPWRLGWARKVQQKELISFLQLRPRLGMRVEPRSAGYASKSENQTCGRLAENGAGFAAVWMRGCKLAHGSKVSLSGTMT